MLLQASQEFVNQVVKSRVKSSPSQGSTNIRCSSPKSASEVEKIQALATPNKTKQNTEWVEKTWFSWATQWMKNLSTEGIERGYKLEAVFAPMSIVSMNYLPGCFILEVRTISGKEYTVVLIVYIYQLCCGLQ